MKRSEFEEYLFNFFKRAFEKMPFDMICALLRVKGLSDSNWDPFEESLDASDDFNWLMQNSIKGREDRCTRRIALLIYCQLVEMTAVQEMLANLLRCIAGNPYVINPFGHLVRKKKKQLFEWVPPSAKVKFREIKKLSDEVEDKQLTRCIDSFFNEKVRNAFSHSDYILTDTEFRYTEGGLAGTIKLSELDILIKTAFDFYNAFITIFRKWRFFLGQINRYHDLPP